MIPRYTEIRKELISYFDYLYSEYTKLETLDQFGMLVDHIKELYEDTDVTNICAYALSVIKRDRDLYAEKLQNWEYYRDELSGHISSVIVNCLLDNRLPERVLTERYMIMSCNCFIPNKRDGTWEPVCIYPFAQDVWQQRIYENRHDLKSLVNKFHDDGKKYHKIGPSNYFTFKEIRNASINWLGIKAKEAKIPISMELPSQIAEYYWENDPYEICSKDG